MAMERIKDDPNFTESYKLWSFLRTETDAYIAIYLNPIELLDQSKKSPSPINHFGIARCVGPCNSIAGQSLQVYITDDWAEVKFGTWISESERQSSDPNPLDREYIHRSEVSRFIRAAIKNSNQTANTKLVFHGAELYLKWLNNIGVNITSDDIIDTQKIQKELTNSNFPLRAAVWPKDNGQKSFEHSVQGSFYTLMLLQRHALFLQIFDDHGKPRVVDSATYNSHADNSVEDTEEVQQNQGPLQNQVARQNEVADQRFRYHPNQVHTGNPIPHHIQSLFQPQFPIHAQTHNQNHLLNQPQPPFQAQALSNNHIPNYPPFSYPNNINPNWQGNHNYNLNQSRNTFTPTSALSPNPHQFSSSRQNHRSSRQRHYPHNNSYYASNRIAQKNRRLTSLSNLRVGIGNGESSSSARPLTSHSAPAASVVIPTATSDGQTEDAISSEVVSPTSTVDTAVHVVTPADSESSAETPAQTRAETPADTPPETPESPIEFPSSVPTKPDEGPTGTIELDASISPATFVARITDRLRASILSPHAESSTDHNGRTPITSLTIPGRVVQRLAVQGPVIQGPSAQSPAAQDEVTNNVENGTEEENSTAISPAGNMSSQNSDADSSSSDNDKYYNASM